MDRRILPRAPRLKSGALFFCILLITFFATQCNQQSRSPRFVFARLTEPLWKFAGSHLGKELEELRAIARATLVYAANRLKTSPELPSSDASEFKIRGTYGRLPEVRVDVGTAVIFPLPVEDPSRFSWSRVFKRSIKLIRILKKIETQARAAKNAQELSRLSSMFRLVEGETALVFTWIRHLETWIPLLKTNPSPDHEQLIQAIKKNKPELIDSLREKFRPHRVWSPTYLPAALKPYQGQAVVFPIATDIKDRKFLAEVEGAVQIHWNQSAWAKAEKIRFQIRWHPMPFNRAYHRGEMDLEQHLERFPKHYAILTTGAQSLHVQGRAMFLSPSHITPRTLAHELGHLMGFADCYFRTLGAEGLFGFAVLEWDNPLYPDDLMCENEIGVARAEVW